jgi:hypothetical protein
VVGTFGPLVGLGQLPGALVDHLLQVVAILVSSSPSCFFSVMSAWTVT